MYKFLKLLCRISLSFYYRKIAVNGLEHVPVKGAVLLVANHQNTFLDAVLIACTNQRNMHSLARGDVFSNEKVAKFLAKIYMHPIYRFRDGMNNMKKNIMAMNVAKDVLADQHMLLMFPEGNHAQTLYLRPLQLGAAKLIKKYFKENDQPVTVIPVGLNYAAHRYSGGNVIINYAQPIVVNSIEELASKEQIQSLTNNIAEGIQKSILHLNENIYNVEDALKAKLKMHYEQKSVRVGVLGSLVNLLDRLNHLIPFAILTWLQNRVIKDPEFKGAIFFGGGTALVPLYFLIQGIAIALIFSNIAWLFAYLFTAIIIRKIKLFAVKRVDAY
ncbi:MAG: 1-acyl-sn-glycerol-3-phosphate acyltransferase [Bacteroidetes bacterium]|nr:1-acyl-sn-glycerol-3-phosphate acyltransferase [Bacteroidota bacterium]